VVWQGFDGEDYEIFFFDNSTGTITRLTNNAFHDADHRISANGDVVWQGRDGADSEIFIARPSGNTTEVTDVVSEPGEPTNVETTTVSVTFKALSDARTTGVTTVNNKPPLKKF
jgi:hypothetical protein